MKYVEGFACVLGVQAWCFETSLSIADWAAWVQAIGSVTAIVAGFGIVLLQASISKRREREVALARHAEDVATVDEVLTACEEAIRQASAGWKAGQYRTPEAKAIILHLDEMHRVLTSMIDHDIESPRLRSALREAAEHLDKAKAGVRDVIGRLAAGASWLAYSPEQLADDALARFEKARAELRRFDDTRRGQLR